jgi:glycosyltransferase involved in cell wall biosynthesis
MSVSVVIPAFNRCELLERALVSVFAQSTPADEVVVVDDGSTDETRQMVAASFPTARCIGQPNRGVSAARNRGIRESVGSWIALLDSDDEWLAEKLERQLAALASNPTYDLCHCDEIWMRAGVRVNQGLKHKKSGGHIFLSCVPRCVISPSSVMIRRTVFDEIGFFNEDLPACEDYDFWLRFCSRRPVLYLSAPLVVKHGGRDDQLSRVIPGLDQYRVRALASILESGSLGQSDAATVRRVLQEKARIFADGARKRGRWEEAEEILSLAGAHATPSAGGEAHTR